MTQKRPYRIACIGECMIEFSTALASNEPSHNPIYQRKFAGDTFNTAYYLKQLASKQIDVGYITALGNDSISEELKQFISHSGIDTRFIQRLTGESPGLYLIENDADGERYFHYWRNQSAAKKMFNQPHGHRLLEQLNSFDSLYLSGITLAILEDEGLDYLKNFLSQYSGHCYFDPNYRPTLWPSNNQASKVMHDVLPKGATVLTTLDDEKNLHQLSDSHEVINLWQHQGCQNVIVKNGNQPCHAVVDGQHIIVNAKQDIKPVDTTGAGDAFNSGYIASIIMDKSIEESLLVAHHLAAEVIQHQGALL